MSAETHPLVAVIMGSKSDWDTMRHAAELLDQFGAAHLPGMVAAQTIVPVLGVPIQSRALNGLDSLLSIVQMPKGVPVGTLAIGKPGAANAALFAAEILAANDPALYD